MSETELKIRILEQPGQLPQFRFLVNTPFSSLVKKSKTPRSTNFCWKNLESLSEFKLILEKKEDLQYPEELLKRKKLPLVLNEPEFRNFSSEINSVPKGIF
jgi:hypothetical protein